MSIKDLKELITFIKAVIESSPVDSERFKKGVNLYGKLTHILKIYEKDLKETTCKPYDD